jgi:hypothetical protein
VIVSDELRYQMMVPHNRKVGVWIENTFRRYSRRVRPTSDMLIDKYIRQQQQRHTNVHHAGFRGEARPGYRQTFPRLGHRRAWE